MNTKLVNFYHVSPDADIVSLRGKYHRIFGCKGMFITNYKSAIHDWAGYVFGKKDRNDPHSNNHKENLRYEAVYLYKLIIPQWVIDRTKIFNDEIFNSRQWPETVLFGFWWWGYQLFVPERYLKYIAVCNPKQLKFFDFIDMEQARSLKGWEWQENIRMKKSQ